MGYGADIVLSIAPLDLHRHYYIVLPFVSALIQGRQGDSARAHPPYVPVTPYKPRASRLDTNRSVLASRRINRHCRATFTNIVLAMAHQPQYDSYPESRQPHYHEQWGAQQGQPAQQYQHQQRAQHTPQSYDRYEGHEGYDEYDGYNGQHSQQAHQHLAHDTHYDQQYYNDAYNQAGYTEWDNGHYEQQNEWHSAQQQGSSHRDAPGYARQASRPQGQTQNPLSHDQYAYEQPYGRNQPASPPRQDPRGIPTATGARLPSNQGRGDRQPPNPPQGRGRVQRPPGLDRSLLEPARPKALPQDNPFPIFPTQKPKKQAPVPAPIETVTKSMAQMDVNGGGAKSRPRGASNNRDPPIQSQHRAPQPHGPENNLRQDSGHFEGQGSNQRHPHGQRPPPVPLKNVQRPGTDPVSDPKSPSQRAFGPTTQRSVTMPQSLSREAQTMGHTTQEHWTGHGGGDGHPPVHIPPRPSTAGGTRHHDFNKQQPQRPPIPPVSAAQQQYRSQYQPQVQTLHAPKESQGHLDNLYDDYYDENSNRQSTDANLDMPNFDAMPETNNMHRRGDSIDNHLSSTRPPHAGGSNDTFQKQASRSRSQPDLHGGYNNGTYMPDSAPPMPSLPRANTGFAGSVGQHGYAPGQPQSFNPRNERQPPPVHRAYSDEAAFSEPPHNSMQNVSSSNVPGYPVNRPGTVGPMAGRAPSDPLGRRPGTTQPRPSPNHFPSHTPPIRPGHTQQYQQQQMGTPSVTQGARPPPVRHYNNEAGRPNLESQQSMTRRQSEVPHPVTYDELNRLRYAWKSNPSDMAIGLKLGKKLSEASNILVDEGGTADTRTKNKNRERFALEALKIVKKLVSSGSTDAMFFLADCYGQGLLGLQVDAKEAFTLYQSAAKGGHAASAYRTAVCCEMGHEEGGGTKRDLLKAVQWYRRAAMLGDAPALYKMGMILHKGLLGQQKNFGEAINMLKRAADRADRENPHALHELGLIYEAQTGNERIIRDEGYALQLFQQAADLGYKFSQFRLGQAYEYGLLGCPIEARTSIAWYSKAAAQGEHQSELALSGWYLTGTSGILEQSDTEAYLWARKAACAEPPLPKALFAMGYFTEVGIGCPNNLAEAKQWYGRAAAFKFPKAQERLEELKKGGPRAQMKRERLSRTNQRQQEENCTVM